MKGQYGFSFSALKLAIYIVLVVCVKQCDAVYVLRSVDIGV